MAIRFEVGGCIVPETFLKRGIWKEKYYSHDHFSLAEIFIGGHIRMNVITLMKQNPQNQGRRNSRQNNFRNNVTYTLS